MKGSCRSRSWATKSSSRDTKANRENWEFKFSYASHSKLGKKTSRRKTSEE